MKRVFTLIVLLTLVLTACSVAEKPKAKIISAKLEKSTIKSGETTNLEVNAENAGKIAATVKFTVTTEAPDKVKFEYPYGLEFTLGEGETTGSKLIKVSGTSETVKTSYLISVYLVDTQGNPYDEKSVILDVTK